MKYTGKKKDCHLKRFLNRGAMGESDLLSSSSHICFSNSQIKYLGYQVLFLSFSEERTLQEA